LSAGPLRLIIAQLTKLQVIVMAEKKVAFLFDVDNTLLDNDRITADLMRHLEKNVGRDGQQRYHALFEELREQLGYADYLGALQRYRVEYPRDFRILAVSSFLVNYPFATRLFPSALDAVERCQQFGRTAIVSDGDVVFQPLKIERSGLMETFQHNVLIYIHKEHELDDVMQHYPADHYVLVDDKARILAAVKKAWGSRVTTVFPVQGHYALDQKEVAKYPAADVTIERIGVLADCDLAGLLKMAK
jgi:FMN phosphatase YigB (HAD superfamily)